jgi:hypothetical protein
MPHALRAQGFDAGAFVSIARTGFRELGHPTGAGLSITWPLRDIVGLRLEASRMTSSPRWTATTCDEYWPSYEGCREETVENDVRDNHYAASLIVSPLRLGAWRLEGILGFSRIDLEHEIAGVETGRPLNRSPDEEGEWHASWGAALVRDGVVTDRLRARLEWHHARVDGPPCGTDIYCPPWAVEGFGLDEARLGASWRF